MTSSAKTQHAAATQNSTERALIERPARKEGRRPPHRGGADLWEKSRRKVYPRFARFNRLRRLELF